MKNNLVLVINKRLGDASIQSKNGDVYISIRRKYHAGNTGVSEKALFESLCEKIKEVLNDCEISKET